MSPACFEMSDTPRTAQTAGTRDSSGGTQFPLARDARTDWSSGRHASGSQSELDAGRSSPAGARGSASTTPLPMVDIRSGPAADLDGARRDSTLSPLKQLAREPAPSETSTVACTDVSSLFSTSLRDTITRVQLVLMRHLRDGRAEEAAGAKVSLSFDEVKFRRKKWTVLHPVLTPHTGTMTCFRTRALAPDNKAPSGEDVRQFIVRFARRGLVSSESLTIALIYVQRLIAAGYQLLGRTWRPIVLAAMLVAAKLWEDRPCWNVEFTTNDMHVPHVNELERHFCKVLKYRLHVNAAEYARYHFALRAATPVPEHGSSANFRSKLASRVGLLGRSSPQQPPQAAPSGLAGDRFMI